MAVRDQYVGSVYDFVFCAEHWDRAGVGLDREHQWVCERGPAADIWQVRFCLFMNTLITVAYFYQDAKLNKGILTWKY